MKAIIEKVIIPVVCKRFWTDKDDLLGSGKADDIANVRRVVGMICQDLNLSVTSTASALKRTNHSTVSNYRDTRHLIEADPLYNEMYLAAKKECEEIIKKGQ